MSRTRHHKEQKRNNWGKDFGAKYKCDKGYAAGTGPVPKDLADKERRNEGKKIILTELQDNDN